MPQQQSGLRNVCRTLARLQNQANNQVPGTPFQGRPGAWRAETMKAITIYQPYASLIAVGAKRYETRSWRTNYRGPVAIHAGLRLSPWEDYADHVFVDKVRAALGIVDFDSLPHGAVIAVADLTECWHICNDGDSAFINRGEPFGEIQLEAVKNSEYLFGDFSEGRYAWELTRVKMPPEPVPCRGRQRLWDVPPDVAAEIMRRIA
jgi:hypothetical protein